MRCFTCYGEEGSGLCWLHAAVQKRGFAHVHANVGTRWVDDGQTAAEGAHAAGHFHAVSPPHQTQLLNRTVENNRAEIRGVLRTLLLIILLICISPNCLGLGNIVDHDYKTIPLFQDAPFRKRLLKNQILCFIKIFS